MGHDKLHAGEHTDGTDDIDEATTSTKGLMSATDKDKLDDIEDGATAYTDSDAQAVADTQIATHASNADAHHAKSHAHDGSDGSGTVEYDDLTDIPATFPPSAHNQGAETINSGTLDGDRLPALSTAKKGGVPATGTPSGKFLKDDDTWATPIFGSEQQGFESEAESSTTSGTLVNKINQDTTSLPAGTYIFQWYAELYTDAGSNRECEAVVEIAGTQYALLENVPGLMNTIPTPSWARMKSALSGFKVLALTAGAKNVKIQFRRSGSSGTAYIANARIHLWRVA